MKVTVNVDLVIELQPTTRAEVYDVQELLEFVIRSRKPTTADVEPAHVKVENVREVKESLELFELEQLLKWKEEREEEVHNCTGYHQMQVANALSQAVPDYVHKRIAKLQRARRAKAEDILERIKDLDVHKVEAILQKYPEAAGLLDNSDQ